MRLTGFQDRAAFVTGAAGGIGQALVAMLRDAPTRRAILSRILDGLAASR